MKSTTKNKKHERPVQTVEAYVTKAIASAPVLSGKESRIYNNLAVAGIVGATPLSATAKSAVDSLLEKLERKLSAVSGPEKAASSNQGQDRVSKTYTDALFAHTDPDTGEDLHEVKLLGGLKALHNPGTRVVYPVPASKSVPKYV